MLSVERLYETGTAYGGHIFGERGFEAEFAVAQIALYDKTGQGVVLSRDEAVELICAIQRALRDG